MARLTTTERAEKVLASVERMIESGEWQDYLRFARTQHGYSPLNLMLIYVQRPDATHVKGFQTWKKFGRHVRKGEHGIRILAPITVKREDESGEKRDRLIGYTEVSVFDVSQTEGDPLPENPVPYARLQGEHKGWDALAGYVEAQGFTITRTGAMVAEGDTNFRTKTVRVRDDVSEAHAVAVLAHEAAHVTLHSPDSDARAYVECRGSMEVEAESVAWIVCDALGLDTSGMSTAYLAGWASDRTASSVRASLDAIVKGADAILDHLDG